MSDIFISYARSTATQAQAVAEALRGLGYGVWLDDELPAHRAYAEVIEERLKAAKAVVVIWSAEAAKSEWVQSEADRARADHKLVQLTVDGAALPMPFDRIQCADLAGWAGDVEAPGWRKVLSSIGDLVGAAASPPTAAPLALPSKPSIAVMPFANLSSDPEQDYFADGMVVEIVEALSRFRSIFVIASSSTLSCKGKGLGPQDIGRQLGVRYVLEGSVRKAGGRVRIAVQLIDTQDGTQIWTHGFEDTLEDVFALQDRVALAVAGKIEPTVLQAEVRHAIARPATNMSSYDHFLRAHSLVRTFAKADMLEALDLAERAVALDPGYGSALGVAAECYVYIQLYGWADDPENNRLRGVEMGRRALKAGGDDAYVLSIGAAAVAYLARDPASVMAQLDRAIAINPGSAFAWMNSGSVRLFAGQTDAGIAHLETSIRLDPLGPDWIMKMILMGWGRELQGRCEDAVALLNEVLQETDHPGAFGLLATCHGHLGQPDLGLEALRRYRALTPQPIDDFARSVSFEPAQLKFFLDGIALAEGKRPSQEQPEPDPGEHR